MQSDYLPFDKLRRLLSRHAARMGSASPDDAAGDAIRGVLRDPRFGPALQVYADPSAVEARLAIQGKGFADLTNFLVGVLHNVVIDEIRARSRFKQVPERAIETFADLGEGPEAAAIHLDRRTQLRQCASALDEPYRSAVALYFSDLTGREIAVSLGQPAARVNNWIFRGLQLVKQCVRQRLSLTNDRESGG